MITPSATLPPEQWTYNLRPRNGIGQNVQVSDPPSTRRSGRVLHSRQTHLLVDGLRPLGADGTTRVPATWAS